MAAAVGSRRIGRADSHEFGGLCGADVKPRSIARKSAAILPKQGRWHLF
jgi:hypothetical protein